MEKVILINKVEEKKGVYIRIRTSSKGVYSWEIGLSGETIEEAIEKVKSADKQLKEEFGKKKIGGVKSKE